MFKLKNKYVMSIERAKKFALRESDKHCYLIENDESQLSLVLRNHRLIIDFKENVVYYETAQAYYDAYEIMTYCRKMENDKYDRTSRKKGN